ncbi:hypothetical protein AAG906_005970 [Vitis piasezkii]
MKPQRRVGLQSPSRRRIQSLDIMTSCSNIVQHGPPLFWTKDLFSGPLFVMLFILHFKWKICVKSNSHFAVEEAGVYSFGIECIYRLDWVILTTFFIVFVISDPSAPCYDLKLKEMISLHPRKEHGFSPFYLFKLFVIILLLQII